MILQHHERLKMAADMASVKATLAAVEAERAALDAAIQAAQSAHDAAKASLDTALEAHRRWGHRQCAARLAVSEQTQAMSRVGIPLPH